MKKIILLLVIFIQLLTVGIISKDIYKKKILGAISINPIGKNTVISSASGELKYFYEPKPNTIIKPEPIFAGLENVSYHINSDGLNQIENYPEFKNERVYRIIILGDSITFGQNVNTSDNYPSVLNKLLNQNLSCLTIKKFEVLNFGVFGYDIQYPIERFKLRGKKYNPDMVIFLIGRGDLRRLNEISRPKFFNFLEQTKKSGEYQKQLSKGEYYNAWGKAEEDTIEETGGLDAVLNIQKKYLDEFKKIYLGKLIISTFPETIDIYKKILIDYSKERENTIFYDKISNVYSIKGATLPDSHPNIKGHILIAESLMNYLVEKKILDCSIK